MLMVSNASVVYGRSVAVREASLEVNRSEIVTLIGANGAGKTSLMNAITGVVPLNKGEIRLEGDRLSGLPSHETVRLGLGYVPEGRQIFGTMSVEDNLILGIFPEPEVIDYPGQILLFELGEKRHIPEKSNTSGQCGVINWRMHFTSFCSQPTALCNRCSITTDQYS